MIRALNPRHLARCLLISTFALGFALALTSGCTQTREAEHAIGIGGGVPKGAERLASGTGEQGINITANKSGTVYVNDESTAEVVYSGKVQQGDPISVEGNSGTIAVGPFKKDVKLNRKDNYSVYIH